MSSCSPGPRGPARRLAAVGQRLPADHLPGGALPRPGDADSESRQSAGRFGPGAGDSSHAVATSIGLRLDGHRRSRRSPRASPPTKWRIGCSRGTGVDGPFGTRRRDTRGYGAEPGKASFANNCLLARRLVERGVRFVQLYHTDWDHHGNAEHDLATISDGLPRDRSARGGPGAPTSSSAVCSTRRW